MQIITVDNYDRGGESSGCDDQFLFSIFNPELAKMIVDLINEEDHGNRFFKAVPNDYKLRKFVP